jgi:2-dehydropantoate 2-reductase
LQNGVDAGDVLAATVGASRTVVGATTFAVAHTDSVVRVSKRGHTTLPKNERLAGFVDDLSRAALSPQVVADVDAVIWGKAAIAVNGFICLAMDVPLGVAVQSSSVQKLARQASREVVEVARAHGVALDAESVQRELTAIWAQTKPDAQSSIISQFRAGRRTELTSRMAPVLAMAEHYGVETPVLAALYQLASARVELYGGQG